ncbi:MAG: flavodoxin [Bacteroidales bacterium]|nr:flavodoxin [Bacteroidales bacterium]
MKILIAYYSRRGQNYVSGNIVNLKHGNTEVVAEKIQKQIGGELFQMETVEEYPIDYTETTNVSMAELRSRARPELVSFPESLDDYDTIYLGYPNWWGTFPMAVFTFLEAFDFSGKTIIPFCTHEGSGLGHSIKDIQQTCIGANVTNAIAIRGGSVANADSTIKSWLNK